MKARLLTQILDNTLYSVSNHQKYIAVGSPMCHDLIRVDKDTFQLKYALDTWNEGRKALNNKDELLFIWDKLQELIDSGEIHEIINGNDEIENPLPVFYVEDGEIIETVTDKYGWPNTTKEGFTMYENTHFPTRKEAIDMGVREYSAALEMATEKKQFVLEDLAKVEQRLSKYRSYLQKFTDLKSQMI